MSSPAGLHFSQADFVARWMPSSTRAGVILSPCPDLAGSLRHTSAMGPSSLEPDDSFASDFAPLPGSADSSCLGVDGFTRSPGGVTAGTDMPVNDLSSGRHLDGELDSLDEMASKSQDLPLRRKLEQLRIWQQQMQERLKANQLGELLRLQEEQQRLLGMMNGSQHCAGDDTELSDLSESDWQDKTSYSPSKNSHGVPQGSSRGPLQGQESSPAQSQQRLPRGQDYLEVDDEEEGTWNPREDDREQSFHSNTCGVDVTDDNNRENDEVFHDRPIKSGIGGQKKTFEELLEEQLRLEEQKLKSQQSHTDVVQAPPKKAFLKRGEGLSRFTNTRKASLPEMELKKDPKSQLKSRVISRSNSEPSSVQKGVTNGVQRLPVQRKTATLNKENRPRGFGSAPQDLRVESKAARMKVLGSHQRQNTEAIQANPERRQSKQHQLGQVKDPNNRKVGPSAQAAGNMQPNPVTKQVGMFRAPETLGSVAAREESVESAERGDGVPQDSFELSFQEKLHRWDCDLQIENMELGEFELLEQAAQELSFSSNSSFVMKVLQLDRQHRGLHPRRLSSTPIKSPPKAAGQGSGGAASGSDAASRSSPTDSVKCSEDALETGVKNKTEVNDVRGGKHEISDISSCDSEFEDQEVAVKPPAFPSSLCFPPQSNLPYDKRSYQDEDSCRDSASDVTQTEEESDGNADESTLIEDRQQGGVVFDDDDTWNDLEDTAVAPANESRGASPVSKATANGIPPPTQILSRKVAASKVVELEIETELPPASQLMTRLFPALKPKTQNAPLPVPSVASEYKRPEEDTVPQVQSRQLRERLVELEIEIERFKKENAALAKLRQENEKNQEDLRKERVAFEQLKAEELAKLEEAKKEENRKLQKDRKLFETHASAARAIPDKKEREEIQALKQQLSSLQEELSGRESRWTSTSSRLRQTIDSLNQEKSALKDEILMLEKLRLSAWKKTSVSAEEKEKEARDAPKMFESNVPSVTKGVKFALPLDSRRSSCAAAIRRGSRDTQGATAMKSSLRRPSGCGPSSSWLPVRKTEERSTPASSSQDTSSNQESSSSSSSSPVRDVTRQSLPQEPECSEANVPESDQQVITYPDGKTETVLAGGDRLFVFPNGTKKEVSADGLTVKVTFFNGDTKEVTADQKVIYYYAEAQTTHITYPDGIEVLHFPKNQTEKLFPDGRKEITFPDQTVKNLFPNGREESVLTDGTVIQVNSDGTKEILFNTGQKEIHTADYKRREYPDGTVKTVFTDGRQETHYPTGRIRIKDKHGNITLDNRA
ncbi:centromere protein J isoform X2 [Pseudochaenichthys georgianus]|uniref:centromere protein J isoform X2 n=1 Tax=Pseudochaenichthys georgianus TaxID=52239 RepID=UPI00146C112F|nr:centromere protein J isoform X2 [Pseudochaenichthys georgianus]